MFLVALIARAANVWSLAGDPANFLFLDSGGYLMDAATWTARGDVASYLSGADVANPIRDPGYVWFLAALGAAPGTGLLRVVLVQAVIDALTCTLIAALGARLSRRIGWIAGIAAALAPNLVVHSALVLQETLLLLPWTAFLLAFVRAWERPRVRRAALAGLCFGVALVVRAVGQFLPIILLPALAFAAWRRGVRTGAALAVPLAFALAAATPIAPVLWRNVANFDAWRLNAQGGLHALLWFVPLVRAADSGAGFAVEQEAIHAGFASRLAARGIDPDRANQFALEREQAAMAAEELRRTPIATLARVWIQGATINLLAPALLSDPRVRTLERPSFIDMPGSGLVERVRAYLFDRFGAFQAIVLAGLLGSGLVFLVQLRGAVALARASPAAALGALVLIGYVLALSGPSAAPKYRMPVEPVLIVLLAAGLGTPRGGGARAA